MRENEIKYLMGPFKPGPKSALVLRVALIKAGVRGAGVISAILKREFHVFEKLSFFSKFGDCIFSIYSFLLTNSLTNIPIKSGKMDGVIKAGVIKAGVKGAGVNLGPSL